MPGITVIKHAASALVSLLDREIEAGEIEVRGKCMEVRIGAPERQVMVKIEWPRFEAEKCTACQHSDFPVTEEDGEIRCYSCGRLVEKHERCEMCQDREDGAWVACRLHDGVFYCSKCNRRLS